MFNKILIANRGDNKAQSAAVAFVVKEANRAQRELSSRQRAAEVTSPALTKIHVQ